MSGKLRKDTSSGSKRGALAGLVVGRKVRAGEVLLHVEYDKLKDDALGDDAKRQLFGSSAPTTEIVVNEATYNAEEV
jgi:hypothetical protein